MTPDITTQQ